MVDTFNFLLRDFSDFQDTAVLWAKLVDLLPSNFPLLSEWREEIQQTSVTLAEGHVYGSIDVAGLIERNAACLMPMCSLPVKLTAKLSLAAYVKDAERRNVASPLRRHDALLCPALARAIEEIVPVGDIRDWKKIRQVMKLGILFQLQLVLWKEAQPRPTRNVAQPKLKTRAGVKVRVLLLAVLALLLGALGARRRSR